MKTRIVLGLACSTALACGDTLIDHDGRGFLSSSGGGTGSGLTCEAPNHACGGACIAEDASSCGDACAVCPDAPAHARAVCSSHACAFQCSGGYLRCSSGCCTVAALATGAAHTCALASDGTVACWGASDAGQLGPAAAAPESPAPTPVPGIAAATAVAAGGAHTCAVTAGAAWCWGSNTRGQLGDGSTTSRATPVAVTGLAGVKLTGIVAGEAHTCAQADGGDVYCWGDNAFGQLGGAGSAQRSTPVRVQGLSATALAAGARHTCALSAGAVRCWGANDSGQLGDGSVGGNQPVAVTAVAAGAISLAAGAAHACAGLSAGSGVCWGAGASGQLGGNTTPATQPTPAAVQVSASFVMSGVAAGGAFTCAASTGGAVKCWGANGSGQIGNGTTSGPIAKPEDTALVTGVRAVSAGAAHACALVLDAASPGDVTVRCWGANDRGQLGDGTLAQRTSPTPISG